MSESDPFNWFVEVVNKSEKITESDINKQRDWSRETFGPGARTKGVIAHIREELDEVLENPGDISEWCDLLILVLDGATRAGHTSAEIIMGYHEKISINMARSWPDWRMFSEDEPINHNR